MWGALQSKATRSVTAVEKIMVDEEQTLFLHVETVDGARDVLTIAPAPTASAAKPRTKAHGARAARKPFLVDTSVNPG